MLNSSPRTVLQSVWCSWSRLIFRLSQPDIYSLTTPYCTIIGWEEPHSASIFLGMLFLLDNEEAGPVYELLLYDTTCCSSLDAASQIKICTIGMHFCKKLIWNKWKATVCFNKPHNSCCDDWTNTTPCKLILIIKMKGNFSASLTHFCSRSLEELRGRVICV